MLDCFDELAGLVVDPDLVFSGRSDNDVAVGQDRHADRAVQIANLESLIFRPLRSV